MVPKLRGHRLPIPAIPRLTQRSGSDSPLSSGIKIGFSPLRIAVGWGGVAHHNPFPGPSSTLPGWVRLPAPTLSPQCWPRGPYPLIPLFILDHLVLGSTVPSQGRSYRYPYTHTHTYTYISRLRLPVSVFEKGGAPSPNLPLLSYTSLDFPLLSVFIFSLLLRKCFLTTLLTFLSPAFLPVMS